MPSSTLSVLYVDDEPALLDICRLFLERTGTMAVTTAESADEALALLREKAFDVVVADYQMPVTDGIALLKIIRAASDIPFILFTGKGREEVVIEALNSGADFYLQKGGEPVAQFAELAHKIRQAVDRRRAERALKESERRLHDLIEFLPDATFAIDRSGTVIAWNRAIEEMTGVAAKEMLGKGDYAYAVPFYGERRPILIDLVLSDNEETRDHYPFVTERGDQYISELFIQRLFGGRGAYTWFIASPLYDPEGNLTGAVESIRDVTERKMAEDAQRAAEATISTMFRSSPDVLAISELDNGRFLDLNDASERIYGYTRDEMVGKTADELRLWVLPGDRAAIVRMVSEQGRVERFEAPQRRKSGEVFTAAISAGMVTLNNVPYLITTVRDATPLKVAEAALKESEERYRNVVEGQTEFICRFTPEGIHVFANDAYLRYFGKTRGELIGHRFVPEIPPEDREATRHHFASLTPLHPSATIEHRIIMPDGSSRWQQWSDTAFFDAGGTVTEYQSVGRDITLKKLTEDQLTASEERYRSLAEASPDLIFVIDRNDRVVYVNSAAAGMIGHPLDQIIGMPRDRLFPPEESRRQQENITKVFTTGETLHTQSPITFGGKRRLLDHVLVPVHGAGGKISGVLGISRDISERRSMEEAIRVGEEKFRIIFRTQQIGILVIDAEDHTIVDANPYALARIGLPKEQVIGRRCHDFICPTQEGNCPITDHGQTVDHAERVLLNADKAGIPIIKSVAPVEIDSRTYLIESFTDITELKQAVKALHDSEENYRGVIENLQDVFYRAAPDGTITMVSPSVVAMAGYPSVQEVIGKNLAKDFYADPSQRAEFLEKISRTGSVQNFEAVLKRKDGSRFTVSTSAHLIRDAGGAVTGIEGIAKDITEWKRAREELRQSEERYRTILDTTSEWIWELDLNGRHTYSNPACEAILGYRPEDMIGRDIFFLVHPDDAARIASTYGTAKAQRRGWRGVIIRWRHHDGSYRALESNAEPIFDAGGALRGFRGSDRDITARLEAEQALRESEEKHRTLIERSFDGIAVHLDGTIVFVNPRAVAIFGAESADQILGREAVSFVHPDSRVIAATRIAAAPSEVQPVIREKFLKLDGSVIEVDVATTPLTWQGKPAVRVVFRDVTDRVQTGEALRQSEEKYRALFNQSVEGIYLHDLEGRILDVNEMASVQSGYSREELLGLTVFDGQPGTSATNPPKAEILRIWSGWAPGQRFTFEGEHQRKDGTVYPVEISTGKICFGDAIAMLAIVKDITERKQAERALIKARDDWETIFQAIGSPAVIVDPSHTILAANNALLAKAGMTAAEVTGMQCWTVFHGRDAEKPPENCPFERMLATCSHETSEMEMEVFGGTYLISCTPIFSTSGVLERVIHIATDITALKEAKSALQASYAQLTASEEDLREQLDALTATSQLLRESESRFSIISALTSDFAFSCTTDDDGSYAIDWMSGAVRAITGFTVDELKERRCWRCLVLEEDRPIFDAHVLGLAPGSSGACELRIRAKNGAVLWLTCNARCEADPGHPGRTRLYGGCRDITSLKETSTALLHKNEELLASYEQIAASEEEIRQSFDDLARLERQTRALNDSLPDIIYRSDTEGNIVYMNRKGLEAFEVNPEEMINQPFLPNLHPDDVPAGVATYRRLLATGEPVINFECRFVTRRGKGRAFPVIQNISVTRDEQGAITGTQGIAIDITEKKRFEAALQESEQRLRHILEQIPGTLWTLDENFIFTSSFGAALKDMGLVADQVIGMSLGHFYQGQPDRDAAIAAHQRALGGEAVSYEARYGDRYYLAHLEPLRHADGTIRGTFGVALDVTDVRRAEMKIRQSEELHRSLVNAIPDGICITSRDGTIAYASPQTIRLFGGTRLEEAVGTSVLSWIAPEDRERATADLKRVMEGEQRPAATYRAIRKDGSPVAVEIGVSVIRDIAGGISGMVASLRDISDRIGEQEALRLAHTKLNLLSVVTRHDILNKLMVIEGFLALMKGTDDPVQLRQYQEKIQSAAGVIRNILAFTRDYQNMGVRAPEWIDIGAALSRQVTEFDLGRVTVHNDMAGYQVYADPLIEKVMYNLIENALRHGRPLTAIMASCTEDGDGLVCTIADDGKGVAAEEKETIFERGVGSGTGLGLFLAREILAVTGLSIRETGEPGKGARFEIRIPKGRHRAG